MDDYVSTTMPGLTLLHLSCSSVRPRTLLSWASTSPGAAPVAEGSAPPVSQNRVLQFTEGPID